MPVARVPWSLLGRVLVLTLLVSATVGFFGLYDRYEAIGGELLQDPGFVDGFSHWTRSGRDVAEIVDGEVRLRATEHGAGVAVRQSVPDPGRYELVRLYADLAAGDIRPGSRFWQKGYLALVSFDENQRMMPVPHVVADLEGTHPWAGHGKVFRIPRGVRELRVSVQLIGATGSLAFKNPSLREVRERISYRVYRQVGMAAWALALLWLALPYLSRLRLDAPHLLVYLAVAGIFAGTLTPAAFKVEMLAGVGTAIEKVMHLVEPDTEAGQGMLPGYALATSIAIDKVGHFLVFALLAFAVNWAYAREKRLYLLLGLLILASVSEVLQFFVDGRLPQISDFFIDGAGLVFGMSMFAMLRRVRPAISGGWNDAP